MSDATIRYGSYGSDVTELQKELNRHGYKLDVDGGYGKKTQAAVKDYQRKHGLAVDGVAGQETWASLRSDADRRKPGSSTSEQVMSGVSDETADRLHQLEGGYKPSDEVTMAQLEAESLASQKPGAYKSPYEKEMEALYGQITERGPFAYDPGEDAAYQRYEELFKSQGRTAMEDTMGQMAALSGGYGSSYAQAAGQQAYERYLQQLTDLLPQMERSARDAYDREGQALEEAYERLEDRDAAGRRAWQDKEKAWMAAVKEAEERFEYLRREDRQAYQALLRHLASKARDEQKAAGGQTMNDGEPGRKEKKPILSSTAGDSLQRAMGNYLKGGDKRSAKKLFDRYSYRMTLGQKKRAARLFGKYGVDLDD